MYILILALMGKSYLVIITAIVDWQNPTATDCREGQAMQNFAEFRATFAHQLTNK